MTRRPGQRKQLVLKLSLSLASEEVQVLFELCFGDQLVGRLAASPKSVHVPLSFEELRNADRNPPHYSLPDYVASPIESVVRRMLEKNEPLWLQIGNPCGYLPVVPWERMLQPCLGVPVMRMSNQDIQPAVPGSSLQIVICVSLPSAPKETSNEAIIRRVVCQIPPGLAQNVDVHLFADRKTQSALSRLRNALPADYKITIHDPAAAPSYTEAYTPQPESSTTEEANPWLIWMLHALQGRSIDVVHFLCHGNLSQNKGRLALGPAPLRDVQADWARLVDAQNLSIFLNRLGAWSLTLSSPPGNIAPSGLRLLADQVSRMRPGPILVHDMIADLDDDAIKACYLFLYARKPGLLPKSAAVSLQCHPLQLIRQTASIASQQLLKNFTLAGTLGRALSGAQKSHAWVTGSQRSLEQVAATLGEASANEVSQAIASGTENALRFTAELLAKAASGYGKDVL